MASNEHEAYEWALKMDVDYVFVVFGGLANHYGDDIGKFMWMPRIASAEFTHIRENDYSGYRGFQVGDSAAHAFKNCLLYKLCYYRNGEVDNIGKGKGWDRNRNLHVGVVIFHLSA